MNRFEIMLEVTTSFTIHDRHKLMIMLQEGFEMTGDEDIIDESTFYDLDIYEITDDNKCIAKVLIDTTSEQDQFAEFVFHKFNDDCVTETSLRQIQTAF
jgi:hypothetical protein